MAEFWKPSPRLLNWALHSASGIVIGIVAVELMPEAVCLLTGWLVALAFACGGMAYVLLESLIGRSTSTLWTSQSLRELRRLLRDLDQEKQAAVGRARMFPWRS